MKTGDVTKMILALGLIGLLSFAGACAPADGTSDAETSASSDAATDAGTAAAPVEEAATAAEDEVDVEALAAIVAACQAEVGSYCSQVTPGGGRLLACFAAHQDKLSAECSQSLFGTVTQLEAFMRSISFTVTACYGDIGRFCADVEGGEGRIAICLLERQAELSADCVAALGAE